MSEHERFCRDGVCLAVRAGERVSLRGQAGATPEGGFAGLGDPAVQAEDAMANVRILLQQAGGRMADIRKLTTYLTDRAWREPVEAVVARHLAGAGPVRVGLIVAGLPRPEMLVMIDVDAVIGG